MLFNFLTKAQLNAALIIAISIIITSIIGNIILLIKNASKQDDMDELKDKLKTLKEKYTEKKQDIAFLTESTTSKITQQILSDEIIEQQTDKILAELKRRNDQRGLR